MFITSQLWLTSHPRYTVVLLDTGTPGTSTEILTVNFSIGARSSCVQCFSDEKLTTVEE